MNIQTDLKSIIRTIPDYPKPGIQFRDITTLLGSARCFRRAVDELVQPFAGAKIDQIAGMEARGFILGGAVAHQLSAGFPKHKMLWSANRFVPCQPCTHLSPVFAGSALLAMLGMYLNDHHPSVVISGDKNIRSIGTGSDCAVIIVFRFLRNDLMNSTLGSLAVPLFCMIKSAAPSQSGAYDFPPDLRLFNGHPLYSKEAIALPFSLKYPAL